MTKYIDELIKNERLEITLIANRPPDLIIPFDFRLMPSKRARYNGKFAYMPADYVKHKKAILERFMEFTGKFNPPNEAFVLCKAYFTNKIFGDNDNYEKTIMDALWKNDKYVDCYVQRVYPCREDRFELFVWRKK